MCLLAFAWNAHPRWRLVLAGNRDEFHARPSASLARWPDRAIVAGRDLEAGGTWLGVTPAGRCATVTNVRDPRASHAGRSRGLLVSDYLDGTPGAVAQADALWKDAAAYRPFNLLLFDARDAVFLGNHPEPHRAAITPGIHGLSNADLDTPWPKLVALRARLAAWIAGPAEDPRELLAALADERVAADADLPDTGIGRERERALSAAFVRGETYGTRASSVVAFAHDGSGMICERAFGPAGKPGPETTLRLQATTSPST